MKKTLLFILLLNLGVASMSHAQEPIMNVNDISTIQEWQQLKYGKGLIAVGNINTSITETIKLKPDTAEFSITYITEGSTPNDASNRNAANMKKLNEYLKTLGINDDHLTTIAYQNYEQEKQQPIADQSKRYQSIFTVNLDLKNEQFFEVVKLLDKNGINDIKQDSYHKFYTFNIEEAADSADMAKQLTQEKYQSIANQLKQLSIRNISVSAYNNQEISPQNETIKKYYVSNTIKIKLNDFKLTGKIIAKAQELKMMVNNDMNYSVSESEKNRILAQCEQTILTKLTAKATRLLGQQYQLGVATHLNSTENDNIYAVKPRSYGYGRAMINERQAQIYDADSIEIQPPAEFELTLTMSGSFETVQQVKQD